MWRRPCEEATPRTGPELRVREPPFACGAREVGAGPASGFFVGLGRGDSSSHGVARRCLMAAQVGEGCWWGRGALRLVHFPCGGGWGGSETWQAPAAGGLQSGAQSRAGRVLEECPPLPWHPALCSAEPSAQEVWWATVGECFLAPLCGWRGGAAGLWSMQACSWLAWKARGGGGCEWASLWHFLAAVGIGSAAVARWGRGLAQEGCSLMFLVSGWEGSHTQSLPAFSQPPLPASQGACCGEIGIVVGKGIGSPPEAPREGQQGMQPHSSSIMSCRTFASGVRWGGGGQET